MRNTSIWARLDLTRARPTRTHYSPNESSPAFRRNTRNGARSSNRQGKRKRLTSRDPRINLSSSGPPLRAKSTADRYFAVLGARCIVEAFHAEKSKSRQKEFIGSLH